MSCVLKVGRRADHGSVYSPARALRLRGRLVAAREPLQPNFTAGAGHYCSLTSTAHASPTSQLRLLLPLGRGKKFEFESRSDAH